MDDGVYQSGAARIEVPDRVRRTSEIEDITNILFVHAIANRLTPVLARLHIHPNGVSIAGMVFGLSAGFAYYNYQDARYAIAGFCLMIAWHVMDGVDGQLARLTHSQSETGKILDGICDYVTFGAVYVALAARLARHHGDLAWVIVAASALCHAVQSASYEMQRQEYDFWGYGRSQTRPRPGSTARGVGAFLLASYAQVQELAIGSSLAWHGKLERIMQSQPERAASIRRRYRATFAQPIRRWSILSANTRTIGIFLFVLVDAPLYYFIFEIFGFSLILAYLTARQRARFARFAEQQVL